uniref:Uncharacterized protein n=1 Tax=Fagus sylvatica TaxID=28930 RepID=A0A2N9GWX2_FAGSY
MLHALVRGWSVRFNFWSGQRSGQTLVKLGRIWSKLSKLWEMDSGPHFEGFRAWWILVGLEMARSNLGQISVNPSQTWSTLVKFGQILENVPRAFFLGVFDVASLCRIMLARFGLSRFACRHSRKSRGRTVYLGSCASPSRVRTDIPGVEEDRTGCEEAARGSKSHFGVTLIDNQSSPIRPIAYLRGSVWAKILSDPLQLGPRAKTLRREVHFSYHTQLSDRQELLRLNRNLSQKMTPWHKEHSDGLRSQDHILRTQAHLCARPVPLENRVFLTRNKLIREPGHVRKKTHSCMTWNSRIAKILSGQAGILIGKLPSNGPKTLRWPLFAEPYLTSPSSDFRKPGTLQNRLRAQSLSGSQQVDLRARVRWKDNDSSYVVELSVRRKHPPFDRNLHRKSARKQLPIPRLPGAITLSSELRFMQTSYRWKEDVESFPVICCMTHFEFHKTSKTALENRVKKKNTRARIEEVQTAVSGGVHARRATITRRARSWRAPRARPPINKASPPLICTQFGSGSRLLER